MFRGVLWPALMTLMMPDRRGGTAGVGERRATQLAIVFRMLTGLAALNETDWSKLHHAYGRATDTPAHLRAILNGGPEERKKGLHHLWSAIIHQGTPWTATGPTALVIAGVLFEDSLETDDGALRANLISFLASVADAAKQPGLSTEKLQAMASHDIEARLAADDPEALYDDEDAINAFFARSVLGCIEVLPELMSIMLAGLDDPNHRVRMCAAIGAATLYKHGSLGNHAPDLPARLLSVAATTQNMDERCGFLLAFGDVGGVPSSFLKDPTQAVRVCAAMTEALSNDSRATDELLAALEHHVVEIDKWFTDRPPQFTMHPRFYVVAQLLKRIRHFERLEHSAVAILSITSKYCVDRDWGPLLAAAFPEGNGIVKTESQRRFLTALTKRIDLWDSSFGNADKWFKKAGLPYDRLECMKRASAL